MGRVSKSDKNIKSFNFGDIFVDLPHRLTALYQNYIDQEMEHCKEFEYKMIILKITGRYAGLN